MLKKEHEILKPFILKPWQKFTFKEIKSKTRKKSESYIYTRLKKFVKERILKEEKAGNVVLYSLNLNQIKSQIYAGIVSEYIGLGKKHIPHKNLQLILKIPTDFFILVITGSYAKNKQRKDSDIDIVIICDNNVEPKKVYAELKHYCEMSIPPIHLYVFKESEFLEMLSDKESNYGKEIANNNIIISGGAIYYRIIAKAVENGFNG